MSSPRATTPRWTSCVPSAITPKGILAQLETRLRQETGIPKLKIGYNHVFGYFIEVSNSYKNLVPETYIRKQTLTSGERYITQELKELESKILGAHERLIALEHRLFAELLETISAQLDRIQRTANAVAELDVLAALAQVAAENNYCRPVVDDGDELTIVEGRHPVVEQMLKGSLFVPNDTTLNCSTDRCLIITGPNMAGKSTYMRQNALIALMAQIGSFVPAKECHVGVVDAIFTRIGASGRPVGRAVHLHGGDDRGGRDSEECHHKESGHSGRDRPRNLYL